MADRPHWRTGVLPELLGEADPGGQAPKAYYFNSLLSLDEVDRVITTLDRRYPDISLKNAVREITSSDYTVHDDVLDIARVYQLFEEGCTIRSEERRGRE